MTLILSSSSSMFKLGILISYKKRGTNLTHVLTQYDLRSPIHTGWIGLASSPHPTAGCHLSRSMSRSRLPRGETNALRRTGAGSEDL